MTDKPMALAQPAPVEMAWRWVARRHHAAETYRAAERARRRGLGSLSDGLARH